MKKRGSHSSRGDNIHIEFEHGTDIPQNRTELLGSAVPVLSVEIYIYMIGGLQHFLFFHILGIIIRTN
jgi:hypothetical protein